jgi:hypothetical protein
MTNGAKAVDYRRKAQECLTIAELVADPLERAELQHIAHAYLRLAERAEDQERPQT